MVFGECEACRKEIRDGDTVWTVNVHREVFEEEGIEVIEAECMLMYCEGCAPKQDFAAVSVPASGD